jgi:hypothetical protein
MKLKSNTAFDSIARFHRIMTHLWKATTEDRKKQLLAELSAEEKRLECRTPGFSDLVHIVWLLNSGRPDGELLRQLVAKWRASGPNLEALFAPPLVGRGQTLEEVRLDEQEQENAKLWRELRASVAYELTPTRTGRAAVGIVPRQRRGIPQHRQSALLRFVLLITNPQWEKLGGPCGNKNCGKFYIKKKTVRPGKYCSRKCAWATTARVATNSRRQREHDRRIHEAIRLRELWKKARTTKGWKRWVSDAGKEYEITPNFLSLAVRNGELAAPVTEANRTLPAMRGPRKPDA